MDSAVFYPEPEGSTDNMEALDTGSTWIEHKHIPSFNITDNLQDMRMAADEDIGSVTVDELSCARIISPRIPTYMSHKDLHALALEETMQGMVETKVMIITVASYTDQRLELRYFRRQIHTSAEIAGMPDLIDRFKEFLEAGVKHSVGVRYETDVHINILFL